MRISDWSSDVCSSDLGVADVLRVARPEVQVTAAEPAVASLLAGKDWSPHKIQGWTPDFVPAVLDPKSATRILTVDDTVARDRSEEHTSEIQSLMRISYAVFCLKKKNTKNPKKQTNNHKLKLQT